MRRTPFIIIYLISINLFAQKKDSITVSNFKKTQIGVNFSSDFCYRDLKIKAGNPINSSVASSRNNMEIPKFGYTSGINFCYNFKKFFGLELGCQFSNAGYQTKTRALIAQTPAPTEPTDVKYIYNFYSLDIPLKANFTFGKKKMCFFTSIGFTTNFFLSQTTTSILSYSDKNSSRNTQTIPYNVNYNNTIIIYPMISAGINYKINKRMSLRAEPTFRYSLFPIYVSPISTYLWNAGLNIGYYFGI